MSILGRTASAASLMVAVALGPAALGVTAGAASAATAPPSLPQPLAAQQAGEWLAAQFNSQGFVPPTPGGQTPSLSDTAQSILALVAAGTDLPLASRSLTYLEGHFGTYVQDGSGHDLPASLALLILDARALGADPHHFGGSDLVARLVATQQTSGADAGLFGSDTQAAGYSAGTYQQGLALTALAAAGVKATAQTSAAVSWLVGQQCPDGGWSLPDQAADACDGLPSNYEGPDTNSTSLAVQGLAAQGALTPTVASSALAFLSAGEDADAGWSYYPSAVSAPQSSDPDSTALVIQGLIALGHQPTEAAFVKGSADPVSALLSFRIGSGAGTGAFYFPPAPAPADLFATFQAVPALAGLAFPWGSEGHGYWEAASDGGVFNFGTAGFYGAGPQAGPTVGMAATRDGRGYWEVAADGTVSPHGDAVSYGSPAGHALSAPVVGMASTPDGRGYWLVASDGGVFDYGDARFYGSAGNLHLTAPVVGVAGAPDGRGYWMVASDGGVFSYGSGARFFGSAGALHLVAPVVGMAASPDGYGYWLVASDGGVFNYGDAAFHGSMGGRSLAHPVIGVAAGTARGF